MRVTSPNQQGVVGRDSEEVWIRTDPSTILIMSASLRGIHWFFPLKEAHFYACLLQVTTSLRKSWVVRQSFIHEGIYLDNVKVFHQVKSHEAYQALPRKVGNQVLIQLHQAWVAFFEAMDEWREHPEKFLGRPKLPKYKHKIEGRNLLIYW